jgi:hypothetical protein
MSIIYFSKMICFQLKYFVPEGRVDVFAVGGRSPICFAGKAVDLAGIPDVDGGGTLPVLLP